MELVYLWVEDYKNIHKQGFNFSPRFRCEYDDEKNELTIDENGDYIENFFGDNINVTAIVGKNGSGKSSVLELLSQILIFQDDLKYFYILYDEKENKCYSNNIKINTTLTKELYIPPHVNNAELDRGNDNYAVKLSNHINMYYLNISHLERDSIIKNDAISFNDPINYLGIYAKNDFEKGNKKTIFQTFSEFNLSKFNFFQTFTISQLLKDIKYKSLLFQAFNITMPYYIFVKYEKEDLIKKVRSGDNKQNEIDKINDFLTSRDNMIDISSTDIGDFFKLIQVVYDYENYFKLSLLTEEKKTIKFSSGERTILYYLERIDYMLSNIDKPTVLIWDEIELYLHPLWQKRILEIIIDFIKKTQPNNLLHIIITSHSPFLLSDMPKQNIIFLDTYKKEGEEVQNRKQKVGNCKVVKGLEEKKQTFGANIHTLLSDSFFMEDGLMGEFAKGKLNEIKEFYEKVIEEKKTDDNIEFYGEHQDKFWQIQKIIGEPFLQKIVKNQLEEIELILLGRDEAIDNEIARLQALKKSSKNA